jgi:hypothetical protein
MDDFLRDCAIWTIREGFDEIKPKNLPTPPTTPAFKEYDNLTPERRSKLIHSFFLDNPEINNYFSACLWVNNTNKANMEWLNEIIGYLPTEDVISRKKVEDRLDEFKVFFNEHPIINKIKNTFMGREVQDRRDYSKIGEII